MSTVEVPKSCRMCGELGVLFEHQSAGSWCINCINDWGHRARALGLLHVPAELAKLREAAKKLIAAEHKFILDSGMRWSDEVTEAVKELEALL